MALGLEPWMRLINKTVAPSRTEFRDKPELGPETDYHGGLCNNHNSLTLTLGARQASGYPRGVERRRGQ